MDRDYRGLLIILGVLLFVVLVGPLFMGWMMGAGMMGPGMMWGFGPPVSPPGNPPSGWSWGLGMGLGWLMMLAFWGVVIIGIALLVRWLSGTAGTAGGGRRADGRAGPAPPAPAATDTALTPGPIRAQATSAGGAPDPAAVKAAAGLAARPGD